MAVAEPPLRCISVVVPVYNERENIAACLRGLARSLAGEPHELLVVYDFDEDTTLEGIRAMADVPPTLRLVRNRIGKGAANAIRAGFAAAQGDVVVTTMADLSDPPEKILELARKMRESGAAVVAGSRYMPGGSQEGGPIVKRTLSRVAGLSLHWFAGIATHDATNNFKAYRRDFLRSIKVEAEGAFDIGLELSIKAHLHEAGVAEVPTSWRDRSAGESRFKVWAWAPKYLRWYVAAMAEPALVWLTWLALALWLFSAATWSFHGSAGDLGLSCIAAGLGASAILLARRIRGRMRWWDGVLALPWTNPRHADALEIGNAKLALGLALISTALFLVLGCGPKRCLRALARLARATVSIQGLQLAAALAFAVVFWIRAPDSGVDVRFAQPGPLWSLLTASGEPLSEWNRAVLWDGLVRGASALVIGLALMTLGKRIEAIFGAALLLLVPLGHDTLGVLTCLAAGVMGIRNAHSGWMRALCMTVLAALAFTKAMFFPLCVAAATAIVVEPLLHRSWWSASVRALYFAAAITGAWIFASTLDTTRLVELQPGPIRALHGAWFVVLFAWALAAWPSKRSGECVLGLALLLVLTLGLASGVPSFGVDESYVACAALLTPIEVRDHPAWRKALVRAAPALIALLPLASR